MAASTYLDVPFTYQAAVLPGPRHTRPRDVKLRGDGIAEVPHLYAGDFVKVVSLARAPLKSHRTAEPHLEIYQWDGRLFSPMTVGGHPVQSEKFSEALGHSAPPWDTWRHRNQLDRRQFPVRDRRHREADPTPLCHPTFGERSQGDKWPAPRVVRSNFDEAMAGSAVYLSGALAIVDGCVWAECCEPVWELRHETYNRYSLVYERWPALLNSHAYFRLDERERALEYAASRRWRVDLSDQDPAAEILDPGSITRNDLTEVAAAALRGWPWLRHYCHLAYGPEGNQDTHLLKIFYTEREVAMHDVPTLMDLLATVVTGPAADLAPRARNHIDVAAVFHGLRRWSYERARVDPASFDPIHDADWHALQDLPIEW